MPRARDTFRGALVIYFLLSILIVLSVGLRIYQWLRSRGKQKSDRAWLACAIALKLAAQDRYTVYFAVQEPKPSNQVHYFVIASDAYCDFLHCLVRAAWCVKNPSFGTAMPCLLNVPYPSNYWSNYWLDVLQNNEENDESQDEEK